MPTLSINSYALRKTMVAMVVVLILPMLVAASSEIPADPPRHLQIPQDAVEIPEGRYQFRFTWNGIPSAGSEVVVRKKTEDGMPQYLFEGTARTSRFADIFWTFRASIEVLFDAVDGRAQRIQTAEQENRKFKETQTIFDYELEEAHYTRWKKGRAKTRTIDLGSGAIDLASFGMMMCRRPLEVGDSGSFTVLFRDSSYALEYEVLSRVRISAAGEEYDALEIEPTFHKIDEEENPPKVRQMTVWLSESTPHIPLRMRSKTFIGHVTGELAGIMPLENGGDAPSTSQPTNVSQTSF